MAWNLYKTVTSTFTNMGYAKIQTKNGSTPEKINKD
jgi:hypothetical protein